MKTIKLGDKEIKLSVRVWDQNPAEIIYLYLPECDFDVFLSPSSDEVEIRINSPYVKHTTNPILK